MFEVQDKIAASAFHHVEDLLIGLYGRWQDEHQFEDIHDYAIPICKALQGFKEVNCVRMTKKPFGFKFTILELEYTVFKKRNQFLMTRKIVEQGSNA